MFIYLDQIIIFKIIPSVIKHFLYEFQTITQYLSPNMSYFICVDKRVLAGLNKINRKACIKKIHK